MTTVVPCLYPMEPPPWMLLADVVRLKPEERALTLVTQNHLPGLATPTAIEDGFWPKSDSVLQQYGAFSEYRLVGMPLGPDFLHASTLLVAAWIVLDSLS